VAISSRKGDVQLREKREVQPLESQVSLYKQSVKKSSSDVKKILHIALQGSPAPWPGRCRNRCGRAETRQARRPLRKSLTAIPIGHVLCIPRTCAFLAVQARFNEEYSSMNAHRSSRLHGFTLAELIATVAVASILLALGVPAYVTLVATTRMTTEVNELLVLAHLARSEAIKRGVDAILCPSADGSACLDDPFWHLGCILFVDANGNRSRDDDEPVLRHREGDASAAIAIKSSAARRLIRYQPDGSAGGSNITITFCDVGNNAAPHALIISNVGRPRTSDSAPDGSALDCS